MVGEVNCIELRDLKDSSDMVKKYAPARQLFERVARQLIMI